MSDRWFFLLFVAVMNLFAIGVLTGHVLRFARWASRISQAIDRALTPPWQRAWHDSVQRQYPQLQFDDWARTTAVLIIALSIAGTFFVYVGSFR